jgi:hypothetical protein
MSGPATCSQKVVYPDHSVVNLPAKTAKPISGQGYGMSWTWTVPSPMAAGPATATATCSYPGYQFPPDLENGFDIT